MNIFFEEKNSGITFLRRKAPLPFIALAIGMLTSYLPGLFPGIEGVSISYLGWIVPLLGCGLMILLNIRQVSFPLWIWLLWILWLSVYVLFANAENALQRTIMMLTPLIVGSGFSTLSVDKLLIEKFRLWLNYFFWIFMAVAGISNGLLSEGKLYDTTGFASGSITASLLAAWYAALYAKGFQRALIYWVALAAVPILANTRTGMIAVALTLPLTFTPLSIKKRLIALVVMMLVGLTVFQSERIQNKMFASGQGTLSDAATGIVDLFSGKVKDSGDFVTSGRIAINNVLVDGLNQAYWFGYGANSSEEISMEIANVSHPHNDWLRLRYEYGMLGLVLFIFTYLPKFFIRYWGVAG
jgi:O-antigen ligase